MPNAKGTIYVIAGPSGVGKGTVISRVLADNAALYYSISATTRAPREKECDGVHYFFLSKEAFLEKAARGEFLEYAQYVDNYYGTPAESVDSRIAAGVSVVLEIDTQGALQVKKNRPEAVLIFVAAPSFEALESRLRGRGTETEEKIQKRLREARREYTVGHEFDYIVLNDDVIHAKEQIEAIMTAENCRTRNRIYLNEV